MRCFGGKGVVDEGSGRVSLPPLVEASWFVGWFTGCGGVGCLWCRRLPLVTLMVGVVSEMVLLMRLARVV